jgi:hypothetical protein
MACIPGYNTLIGASRHLYCILDGHSTLLFKSRCACCRTHRAGHARLAATAEKSGRLTSLFTAFTHKPTRTEEQEHSRQSEDTYCWRRLATGWNRTRSGWLAGCKESWSSRRYRVHQRRNWAGLEATHLELDSSRALCTARTLVVYQDPSVSGSQQVPSHSASRQAAISQAA